MRGAALAIAEVALVVSAGCKGAQVPAGEIATAVAINAAATIAEAAATPSTGPAPESADGPPVIKPRAIDLEHVRAVLLETSLADCWPRETKHGPADVEVTFRRQGTVVKVGVAPVKDGPKLDPECAAAKLRDVIVDPFDGDPVVVRVRFSEP